MSGFTPPSHGGDIRRLAEAVARSARDAIGGRTLNVGRASAAAGASTLTINDPRIGMGRVVSLSPINQDAAPVGWWAQSVVDGQAVFGLYPPPLGVAEYAYYITGAGPEPVGQVNAPAGYGLQWKDYNVELAAIPGGAAAPSVVTIAGGVNRYYALNGSGPAEYLTGKLEIDHDWAEGTDIIPHIHWLPTATGGTGNVKWNLSYSWTDLGQAEPPEVTLSVTQAAPSTIVNSQAAFPAISGAGKKVGSQFCCTIWRNSGDAADTFSGAAAVKTFGVHAQINSFGSRSVTVK